MTDDDDTLPNEVVRKRKRTVSWENLTLGAQLCCVTNWVLFAIIAMFAGMLGGALAGAM